MNTVTDAAWDYVNEMAQKGIMFGVALKYIRQTMLSGETPEEKIHAIEIHMGLINSELDDFIQEGGKHDK